MDGDEMILNIIDDKLAQEGLGQMVQLGVLASVLGFSGIVNAQTFKNNLYLVGKTNDRNKSTLTISKSDLKEAISNSRTDDSQKKIGKWTKEQIINIVARTLWMEARGDGDDGLNMVLTVIWNRAGGIPEFLADKCLEKNQFSCWNKFKNNTPETYSINFPKSALSGIECSTWNKCQSLATNAVEGTFVPKSKDWNSYYNPDLCNPSWGKQLANATLIGHHKVGCLKEWKTKANRLKQTPTTMKLYVVKKNDNLWKIAKNNGTTVDKLKSLNGLDSDLLKIGQKLKIS